MKAFKRYHQEGFGLKTMVAGAAAGLMFAFAANPATIASLFGGQWPQYVPQAPFEIFAAIAGIGLGYETFHLYRQSKKLSKK
jgi:spermidine/putrescine-binding protein